MNILMVCLGNICRSPLAEGILRHKLTENNIDYINVDSAGTANYHVGEAPDERTQKNALSHQVDLSKLRARQFVVDDFDKFDRIYVMDASNYTNVLLLARNESDKNKVELLLNTIEPNSNKPVPDPYFGGPDGFEHVFQLVNEACENIIKQLND